MTGTKTTIMYCLLRVSKIYPGNFEEPYIQVYVSNRDSLTQLVAPTMIYQRKDLMDIMKKSGPVSPAKFNGKMVEYSAAINVQPFEVSRLVINKINSLLPIFKHHD